MKYILYRTKFKSKLRNIKSLVVSRMIQVITSSIMHHDEVSYQTLC